MEEAQSQESWDLKRILIAVVLAAIIILGFKTLVLDQKSPESSNNQVTNVQGATTFEVPSPSPVSTGEIRKGIENKLIELKKEVNNINVVEVATSTPAVQKVLNDLKNLQNLPQSQAKEACFKICSGF